MIDHTHQPDASSWVDGADAHPDFPVQNLPLGIFSSGNGPRRTGTAIGPFALDLGALADTLPEVVRPALQQSTLNALFALPASARLALRQALFGLLIEPARQEAVSAHLYPLADVQLHLPFAISDYTDFYVGIHHATNIGKLFRPDNPLLPNYKHVPIGYHGRASSVRVSGTPVIRPKGQIKAPDAPEPSYAPCRKLDYELELAVWIAGDHDIGATIPIADAWERIGGICLLNDWSARDIQAWEYQPLGPFLAKNFLTTVSPWVVTAEALAPFRVAPPPRDERDPSPLPYLLDEKDLHRGALSLALEAHVSTKAMRDAGHAPHRLSEGRASDAMYWTIAQMVAHHASGGCNLQTGDLLGTGTLSMPDPAGYGSLMELSLGGTVPVPLPGGVSRTFLEDGDELILTARAEREGYRSIGLGQCRGVVEPAR